MGRAEMALGDYDAAAKSFSEALRLAPTDVEAAKALREARAARLSEKNESRVLERDFVGQAQLPP